MPSAATDPDPGQRHQRTWSPAQANGSGMSGPPVPLLGASGPTSRVAEPSRITQSELPRGTASAPSADQASPAHHGAPHPFRSTKRFPRGVHSTTAPSLVTYAARSPVGAQASVLVGNLACPTIVPPMETRRPSPLNARDRNGPTSIVRPPARVRWFPSRTSSWRPRGAAPAEAATRRTAPATQARTRTRRAYLRRGDHRPSRNRVRYRSETALHGRRRATRVGAAGRFPVYTRAVPRHVSRPAVDASPVRRLCISRGVERALPLSARARSDGAVDRVRPADATRLRLGRSTRARRGRPDGRCHRLACRHGDPARRDPARRRVDVDDDQRAGLTAPVALRARRGPAGCSGGRAA